MRETSSRHFLDVSFSRNKQTGYLLPTCDSVDFPRLAECLSVGSISCEDASDSEPEQKAPGSRKRSKGKRRSIPKNIARPVKRRKIEGLSAAGGIADESAVPIIRHTFEIEFVLAEEEQDAPEVQQSISPFRDFLHVISSKCSEQVQEQDEVIFDVGTIYPHAYLGKVHACKDDPFANGRMFPLPLSSLFILPALFDSVKDIDHDFNSRFLKDILASAFKLQQNRRARVSGPLCVIVPNRTALNREDRIVPVTLRAEITISLIEPAVFEPLTTFRKKDSEIEEAQRRVLTYAFGSGPPPPKEYSGTTDMPFFLSCLHPAALLSSDEANQAAQPADLLPQLLPFQRRTVNWLLSCEARRISEKGQIEGLDKHGSELPLFWEGVSPIDGKTWYLNHITGCLLKEPPPKDEFFGGILAEEPGLGKTLESIALVLLNPSIDRNPSVSRWDPVGVIDVKEVKTTLIVTPAALAQQWVDELKLHAPSLKVLVYEGWTKVPVPITTREAQDKALQRLRKLREPRMREKLDDNDILDEDDVVDLELSAEERQEIAEAANQMIWCDFVHQYDICITTYNNLQHDLGVARAPLQRPRREVAKYADIYRDRSPLVMVEWNRVIMDEVQMVGGGKTEEMVSLIPRLSSFAVSGTPARSKVDDLVHVIKFLRINSVIGSPKTWLRLQKPAFAAYFRDLFGRIAVRTMKAKVQNELTIPQQSRFVVPIELGKVERHIYDENFEQALNDLGLDARGVAASSSWQVDVTILRNWMRRLRGICTHPQVGKLARQNDRLSRAGTALKSIGEVLEDMKDQNWRKLMDEKKTKIQVLVRRSQLIQHSDNPRRSRLALEILLNAREEMDKLCTEISDVIAEHNAKGEILKREALEEQRSAEERDSGSTSKGKNPEREASMAPTDNSLEDDLPTTPAGMEHRHKKHSLQARLREAHVVLHQIYFRLGDVYHALGESHNNEENHSYGAAEVLRKRLLNTTEQIANRSIAQVKLTAERKTITKEDMAIEYCGKGGINSEELLRKADKIIDILNQQAELLIDWRARIIRLLTESLSASEGDSADGEEYARTLETQGEAETYLQAFVALLADRRELLVAERTALAAHESKERRVRHTAAAQRAQNVEGLNPEEMAPEHEVLEQELTEKRKAARTDHDGKALKSIFVQLQQVAGSYVNEKDPEKIIAKQWITNLKLIMKEQTNFHEKLDADLAPLRKAFNDRIQYFRQLQELSDSVRDVDWEGSINDAIEKTHVDEDTTDKNINERRARQRYLRNLTENEDDEEDEKCCILCRCEFVRGFMTQCAHVYCEDCLKAWFSRGVGRACPICRIAIDPDQLQRITLEEKKVDSSSPKKRYVPDGSESAPHSRRVIEYNTIDPDVFEELQKIVCLGSYGTKIETIVRHLLYLEEVDPGCKSIVFSAWADSLYILERALNENGIACLRIDQKKGGQNAAKLFKTDHRIRVLLLHGERENAGLNVTCASRVFLTESVVQHSFELQAIARIDRLGQTRPTEVYCYYAENTVERNILDLAAKRGLSLYTKDHAIGTVKVTSFEMDKNRQIDSPVKNSKKQKGQKGDFIFKADDMLAILFPHLFEDVEYLLPEGTETDMLGGDFGDFDDGNDGEDANAISEHMQPVAGPSRLADLMNGRSSTHRMDMT